MRSTPTFVCRPAFWCDPGYGRAGLFGGARRAGSYQGTHRNGVISQNYGGWDHSYRYIDKRIFDFHMANTGNVREPNPPSDEIGGKVEFCEQVAANLAATVKSLREQGAPQGVVKRKEDARDRVYEAIDSDDLKVCDEVYKSESADGVGPRPSDTGGGTVGAIGPGASTIVISIQYIGSPPS